MSWRAAPHDLGAAGLSLSLASRTSAEIETPIGNATMTLTLSTAPKAGEECAIIILRQR